MKIITVSTLELDEPEIAVEEILEQVDLEKDLNENSVGIITCTPEFLDNGIVEAIDEVLPFTTIGMTTLACGTNSESGLDVLSLSIYTADDVDFVAGVSEIISGDNLDEPIANVYKWTRNKLSTDPKLIIPFGPLVPEVSGEKIIDKLHIEAGEIPVFGSMACSSSFNFDTTYVIYNGKPYEDSLAILMMSGNVNPRFFISTISEDKITKQKAIITDSEGSILKEVNGVNLVEYMKTIGLSQGNGIEGSSSIPFVVDYGDGTKPSVRGIYSVNDDGHAFCGGEMPMGSTLAIGTLDPKDIVKTAGDAIDDALNNEDISGILMFPCQARNHLLEMDYMAEMNKVKEKIEDTVPYHIAYSGGEICPSYDDHGKPVNRYHNFTFISCVF